MSMESDGEDLTTNLSKQLAEVSSQFEYGFGEMARSLEGFDFTATLQLCRSACGRMGQLGWTLPMRFSMRGLVEISELPPAEIDNFFVEYYCVNDFAELRRVRAELSRRHSLVQWKALLDECFDSFESGKHLITIPALLSVIEGIVSSAGYGSAYPKVANLKKICAAKAADAAGGVKGLMWYSLELLTSQLFQAAPFNQARPTFINRHWILHGREDAATWTIADSLRLFNALQTVDSLRE
jgi:hypothetical protein